MPHDVEHLPERPSWRCLACDNDWPCAPAKQQLAEGNSPTGLTVLMWGYMEDFSIDAGPGPLGEPYQRFIAWAHALRYPQRR